MDYREQWYTDRIYEIQEVMPTIEKPKLVTDLFLVRTYGFKQIMFIRCRKEPEFNSTNLPQSIARFMSDNGDQLDVIYKEDDVTKCIRVTCRLLEGVSLD